MADEVMQTKQKMGQIRADLLAGKVFKTLPEEIGQVMDGVVGTDEEDVAVPTDNLKALAQINALAKSIKANHQVKVSDAQVDFLIDHLASVSPAVRDKGVFFLFNDMFQYQILSAKQLAHLVERLQQPEILYHHILGPKNEGVFQRSFAVMILAGAVYADLANYHTLSAEDYEDLVLSAATYIALERDGRGYVDGGGWAHAYLHIGNLVDELDQVPSLSRGQKVFLMGTLIEGWQRMSDPLVYGEDYRIAACLTDLAVKHQFYAESLVLFLTHWQNRLMKAKPRESEKFWNRWYNRNRLLEALLMRADMPKEVVDYLQRIVDFE